MRAMTCRLIIGVCVFLIVASCSTTTRISEEDPLYTGIKEVKVEGKLGTDAEAVALEEMNGALAYEPNNSLFGSSSLRSLLPIGLWIYNSMDPDSLSGMKKWFYNTFSSVPKTISSASPATRAKVATNVLQNYGYFQGNVDYRLITSSRNPRKQQIAYDVSLGHAYTYDSIKYVFHQQADSLVRASLNDSYLRKGEQFSVADLQLEKSRLTTVLHNNGYYYFRPDYIKYLADSINSPGRVKLLVAEDLITPDRAKRQWRIGKIDVFLRNGSTGDQHRRQRVYDDTIHRPRFDLAYQGKKVPIRIPIVMRNFKFWTGMLYSEDRVNRTLTQMANLNTFSSTQFSFSPADSTDSCSVLNVRFEAAMDKLVDLEFDFNFTQKSNSQIGPDAAITLSRRNAFRNGEKLSLKLRGSYYWQLRGRSDEKINNLDTYDYGADLSLEYPWLVFPYFLKHNFYRPTSSDFSISFTRTNLAKALRYNQFALGVEYKFHPTNYITHAFTPLRIEVMDVRDFNIEDLSEGASAFNSLSKMLVNDAFIPSMQYSFTYDNSSDGKRTLFTNFNITVKESGNLTGVVYAFAGKPLGSHNKKLAGKVFEQFVKFQAELRNRYVLAPHSCIATRLLFGNSYYYGNSSFLPYSESFYSGGAYSVRAFPARSLGPSNLKYSKDDIYLLHAGEIRFEANVEYRFPLFGNLYGALFVDAGNVWNRPYSKEEIEQLISDGFSKEEIEEGSNCFTWRNFARELALGTGFGLRYDMEFLVLRLDLGVAIHAPYDTGKSGYYNIPRFFKNGLGINLAVGYPF